MKLEERIASILYPATGGLVAVRPNDAIRDCIDAIQTLASEVQQMRADVDLALHRLAVLTGNVAPRRCRMEREGRKNEC